MTSESVRVTTWTINLFTSMLKGEGEKYAMKSSLNVEKDTTPKLISPYD